MSATISFCICTRGPAARVEALLRLMRPHVDEIVLAADRAGDPDVLDACAEIADQRLLFDLEQPPCRLIGWIQNQSRSDWLLRLDDDEVPSRALLDALPGLVRDRRPTHYGITRRWLYRDDGTYILSPPWQPDYQLRLLRNMPGIWHFSGNLHDPPFVLGEMRLLDLPIYHADLVLSTEADRRRKAEEYERLRPGHCANGVSVNAMYVPEDWHRLATETVPGNDQGAIAAVLHAKERRVAAAANGAAVRSVAHSEIERFNATRSVQAGAYRAHIEFVRPLATVPVDGVREQEVLVRNLGDEHWPWGLHAEPPIQLGYRWRSEAPGGESREGVRTQFTERVLPGETTLVRLRIHAPHSPGTYTLEVDVVHEGVRWFGCEAALEVDVVESGNGAGPFAYPAPTYTGGGMRGRSRR